MTDRILELADIQGNVLGGFNTDFQEVVSLTVAEPSAFDRAAKWIAAQAEVVTPAADVHAQRTLTKSALPDPRVTWLGLAIGLRVLKATQPDVLIRDDGFNGGMLRRAPSILSDKTDAFNWKVGGPKAPIDVLLIVAGNNEGAVGQRANELCQSAAGAGLVVSYRETGRRLDDREQFGFRDGISQPKVIGYDSTGCSRPVILYLAIQSSLAQNRSPRLSIRVALPTTAHSWFFDA